MADVPQPFPYQGSKRKLAPWITQCLPQDIGVLYETFAGSAAVSLAAAKSGKAKRYVINDLNTALVSLWRSILEHPEALIADYQKHWMRQSGQERAYYDLVRSGFNAKPDAGSFLFLLARCVKGAIRYNRQGEFNQSPDNRRRGMKPETLAREILAASRLLSGRTELTCLDFVHAATSATPLDVIYMDPPYQGVSGKRDARYICGLSFESFVAALEQFNKRELSYIISYDGRTGDKTYGEPLPGRLKLKRVELAAGRSTTATLLGRTDQTVESLYLSAPLVARLNGLPRNLRQPVTQRAIQFA